MPLNWFLNIDFSKNEIFNESNVKGLRFQINFATIFLFTHIFSISSKNYICAHPFKIQNNLQNNQRSPQKLSPALVKASTCVSVEQHISLRVLPKYQPRSHPCAVFSPSTEWLLWLPNMSCKIVVALLMLMPRTNNIHALFDLFFFGSWVCFKEKAKRWLRNCVSCFFWWWKTSRGSKFFWWCNETCWDFFWVILCALWKIKNFWQAKKYYFVPSTFFLFQACFFLVLMDWPYQTLISKYLGTYKQENLSNARKALTSTLCLRHVEKCLPPGDEQIASQKCRLPTSGEAAASDLRSTYGERKDTQSNASDLRCLVVSFFFSSFLVTYQPSNNTNLQRSKKQKMGSH